MRFFIVGNSIMWERGCIGYALRVILNTAELGLGLRLRLSSVRL